MESEKVFHNWLVTHLRNRLSRQYTEIVCNPDGQDGENKHEFDGFYPDLILKNYGMAMAVVEVETEESINAEKAKHWKALSQKGVKLILMIPEKARSKVTGLLWDLGLAADVAVGSYDLRINMP
ncbi:hypothetical protein [Candidatus Magnetominusculus xianensis]|uniref:Uncharacterized protein n=1 Tax=Candidatus Magnetominusculus xianensis TaxID=1748249 RepID=A0ABR5SD95_9BACT|nr:hypothetical protein [Candidatus Magnetominusculus xianensis]KWT82921.1 hypothetical protein ASN18_2361 [Candidatus Magnetominusculus xianensis]MBF0405323.1 hypothetical protein [Nitrospirota bacterium]